MFFKARTVSVIFIMLWALTELQAQEVIPASGGEASGNGGSVSYTVGQIAYTFHSGNDGSVSQGVQQPYEIYTEVETAIPKGIELFCTLYPNPVNDRLIIKTEANPHRQALRFQLYDMHGKTLQNGKIKGSITYVHMTGISSGIYLLKVIDGNTEVITFKIIKNP